jgi:hypothetical protein
MYLLSIRGQKFHNPGKKSINRAHLAWKAVKDLPLCRVCFSLLTLLSWLYPLFGRAGFWAAILAESNSVAIAYTRFRGSEVLGHHWQIISYSRFDAHKKALRRGVPYGLQSHAAGASYRLLK